MTRLAIIFLVFSTAFAIVHLVAMAGSLYWYYWWFDVFMHTWGGLLLALGVHAICRFKSVRLKPTLFLVFTTLCVVTVSWEIFEWTNKLYNPIRYVADTTQDILFAFGGGLLTHFILSHLYNRRI